MSVLSCLLCFSLGFPVQSSAVPVYLPEDEFVLPPLLYRIETQTGTQDRGLNITDLNQKKRYALTGEWLRFGDSLDLNARLAVQVIQKENLMWISGGVFQGRVGTSRFVQDDQVYDLSMSRGWIRVWVKPGKELTKIQIKTLHGTFQASDAEFWLSTRPDRTEIYLIRGEIKRLGSDLSLVNQSYAIFESGKDKPRYIAKSWNADAIEVTLASSYPSLGKLVVTAKKDWEWGRISRAYANYRKKGWRKADPKEK